MTAQTLFSFVQGRFYRVTYNRPSREVQLVEVNESNGKPFLWVPAVLTPPLRHELKARLEPFGLNWSEEDARRASP